MKHEVSKRDVWDEHWTELNEITEVNPAQHYRHRLLTRVIEYCLKQKPDANRVFDFGSGQGDLIKMLGKGPSGREYYGLELSQVGVDISSKKYPVARFFKCNLLDPNSQLPDLYGKAQLGICSEVLEHIDEPAVALSAIRRYLAPGAQIIITVPGGPMNEFEKSIGHRMHYSKAQLAALLEKSGLRPIKFVRAGFPFFNLYKLIALARGKKLLQDTGSGSSGEIGGSKWLMMLVLKVFEYLFRLNLSNSPFGWQMLVIAENPA
jgi:SAM-dependent methyltransferase